MIRVFMQGVRVDVSTLDPLVPTFLLVEDNPTVLSALGRRLSNHGPVLGVMTATEALAVIDESRKLRAIVLDWKLPDGVGGVVAEHARARTFAPILIITGCDEADAEIESWRHGARFLRKPVDDEKLAMFARETDPVRQKALWSERCAAYARRLADRWNLSDRLTEILFTAPEHYGDPTDTYNALAKSSRGLYCRGTFNNQVHALLEVARACEGQVFLSLQSLTAWVIATADH